MRRWIAVLLTVGWLAAACTGGAGSDPTAATLPTTEGVPSTVTTSSLLDPTTVPETTTTTALAATTTTVPGVASAACLVGEWELDSEVFVDTLAQVFASEFPDATVEFRSGLYVTTLGADGSMSGVREAWTMAIGTEQGTLVHMIDAEDSGMYEVDEAAGTITVNLDPGGVQTVTTQFEVDGELRPLPFPATDTFPLSPETATPTGTFSCSDDRLIVASPEGVVSEFARR